MTPSTQKTTLTAANDNPGGSRFAEIALTSFVRLLARAYVDETRAKAGAA